MNHEIEKQTAITKFAELHGIIPIKPRINNRILGRGMSNLSKIVL